MLSSRLGFPGIPRRASSSNAAGSELLDEASRLRLVLGPLRCPDLGGPVYDMTFLYRQRRLGRLVADTGGCGTVEFGPLDVRLLTPAYGKRLREAMAGATPLGSRTSPPLSPPLSSALA